MTDPVAEAGRLARPSVLLKRAGRAEDRAGVWGGPGLVPAPAGPFRHWISIDCRFLPAGLGPGRGVLSVYTDEEECVSGFAGHDPAASLEIGEGEGEALYAHPAPSFPPPDALPVPGDKAYQKHWQSRCPLFDDSGEVVAVLGGWHFPWPEGDWDDLRDQPLLVWTIEDSEPWVEVWGGPGGFRVLQRIT